MTGGTGHRRGRWGLWTIAVCSALRLLLYSGQVAIGEVYQTLRSTSDAPYPATELAILAWADVGLLVAISIGVVLLASARAEGRRWFLLAAALPIIGTVARLAFWYLIADFDVIMRWGWRIPAVAWLVAGLAFARGLHLSRGASRTAIKLFAGLFAAHALVFLWSEVTAPARDGGAIAAPPPLADLLVVLHVVEMLGWLYLVLDSLGAFPAADGAPQAALRSGRARGFATAAGIALTLAGSGLLAAALWSTRLLGVDTLDRAVSIGITLLLGGACGLWRLRAARVPLAAVGIGALVLVVGTRLILATAEEPAREVALEPVDMPGLTISLPAGTTEHRYVYREVGSLAVRSRHLDVGTAVLAWSNGSEDPITGSERSGSARQLRTSGNLTSFESNAEPISYRAEIWEGRYMARLEASWRCPGDGRWFTVELTMFEPLPAALRALGERIMASARCDPASLAAAPPLLIPLSPPAGYRPVAEVEPQTAAWEGPQGDSYSLVWSSEFDYALTLTLEPETLLDAYQVGQLASRIEWLDPIQVGDDSRRVGQVVADDGTRYLVTAWSCYPTGVSVAAFRVGPASLPREPAIEVFRSGACPPAN